MCGSLIGPLVLLHRLMLFFSDVYRFPDPPVHSVAFSVDHLGAVTVYDIKVKGAMPQLGRRRGAHLPLAAVEPVGG